MTCHRHRPPFKWPPQLKLSRPLWRVISHEVRSYTSGMTEMTPSCPIQRELLCLAHTTNGPEIAVTGYGHQREGGCAILIHSQTCQRKVTSASMVEVTCSRVTCVHFCKGVRVTVWPQGHKNIILDENLDRKPTHRGDDGWETPLRAEESFAVQASLFVDVPV